MATFFPSIHPSLLSSCRNVSKRTAILEAVLSSRNPMRKIFPACCAHADEHGAWSREHGGRSKTVKKLSAKSKVLSARIAAFMFIFVFGFVLVCPLF
jgi:hypothetical protein